MDIDQEASVEKSSGMGPITQTLVFTCVLLLGLSYFFGMGEPKGGKILQFISSPIDKYLLYDFPERYALIDAFIDRYGLEGLENTKNIPQSGRALLEKINSTPIWDGFYDRLIDPVGGDEPDAERFEKIRQGQVWRLVTPALLHGDLFHLFFNLLWLIVLGRQMELKLSKTQFLIFLLIAAAFTNTVQYLMTGPNFLGFSGVLCGMLTFIWTRQSKAPWEGYRLDRSTFYFMMLFIFGMAALQVFSFALEKTTQITLPISIANSAHLSGALIGYLLGQLNTFSWRTP